MDEATVKPKIVLADDEQFILIAYKTGLEQAGYDVEVAHDGEEALALVRAFKPDLVLLDIIMPKLNGFEVLDEIRADHSIVNTPVIVLTNLSQASDRDEAVRHGANAFLTKADISLNDLLDQIQTILQS